MQSSCSRLRLSVICVCKRVCVHVLLDAVVLRVWLDLTLFVVFCCRALGGKVVCMDQGLDVDLFSYGAGLELDIFCVFCNVWLSVVMSLCVAAQSCLIVCWVDCLQCVVQLVGRLCCVYILN